MYDLLAVAVLLIDVLHQPRDDVNARTVVFMLPYTNPISAYHQRKRLRFADSVGKHIARTVLRLHNRILTSMRRREESFVYIFTLHTSTQGVST